MVEEELWAGVRLDVIEVGHGEECSEFDNRHIKMGS